LPNPSHPVARVYAAALARIGNETNSLGQISDDIEAVRRLYDTNEWFRGFFTSPRLDRKAKWIGIEKAVGKGVCPPVLGLLRVLIKKGRESVFDNIADQFAILKDEVENRVHAHVLVAQPLTPELRKSLEDRLGRETGKTVQLHERVDPAVLGGAAIRVGDRIIDRTLKTRLAVLKKQLLHPAEQRNKQP
jgi:F-type H+-transporting ATPase subunit delta